MTQVITFRKELVFVVVVVVVFFFAPTSLSLYIVHGYYTYIDVPNFHHSLLALVCIFAFIQIFIKALN